MAKRPTTRESEALRTSVDPEAREQTERALVAPVMEHSAEVGWALRAVLTRYNDVLHEVARRLSIPTTDVLAVQHLMQDPTLGPMDLAHRLGITSASATALVDRLERAGHVVRMPHLTDRRRRILEVTPRAKGEVFGVLAPLFQGLEEHDQSFPPADQALIERYLRGVVRTYDGFLGGGKRSDSVRLRSED